MSLNTCRQLLMIWHSRTGAARQLAEQAEEGALEVLRELDMTDHLRIKRVHCDRVQAQDLRDSQAYLFCAPENLASLSGAMKECLDRNYYAVLDQLNGRPYSAFISAGSDGQGAQRQLERICTGWRLELVAPIRIFNFHAQTPESILAPKSLSNEQIAQAREAGGHLAALLCL
ncbi:flavodoxin family protein [Providencia rettgeri]|nr:flavodoxin family protein [Providencia rettgeri]